MAITFPRDFPNAANPTRFESAPFILGYSEVSAPTRGGLVQVALVGTPLWQMEYKTRLLPEAEFEEWRAWLSSLRAGVRQFKAWEPRRRHALAYRSGYGSLTRAGGGSFAAGTANLSAIAGSRDKISLSTLPAGFVFSFGDMVSIPFGSSRSLHRVTEPATASGAGHVTLGVEPALPLAVVTGATVDLARPWCLAVLEAGSITETRDDLGRGSVAFKARQTY